MVTNLHPAPERQPYRQIAFALLAVSLLGVAALLAGGVWLRDSVLFAVAIAMGLISGILLGVITAQTLRAKSHVEAAAVADGSDLRLASEDVATRSASSATKSVARWKVIAKQAVAWTGRWLYKAQLNIDTIAGLVGVLAIVLVLTRTFHPVRPSVVAASIVSGVALLAAGVAGLAARYFANLLKDGVEDGFSECAGLCSGSRVLAWVLLLVATSPFLLWANLQSIHRAVYFILLAFSAAICFSLLRHRRRLYLNPPVFSLEFGVVAVLGRRANIFASVLDSAEQQLGIDLRSTWALTLVRTTLEPLVLCLCLIGWLSTSLTVVGLQEQGLVERLGKPHGAEPLNPGLHLHLPWPIDRVTRIPVQRVQKVQVGHDGDESEGPENVLWAVEHAPSEYTLLLGNGRDLITVDASVQYRISNARAWAYNSENPAVALRAIAYRAVMRSTVDLTLSEALSQNVAVLTNQMKNMVQREADDLGLGVEIISFTVGGMHPPVTVAQAYENVVSSQLGKVTAVVDAEAYRNTAVPTANADVITGQNRAQAEGYEKLALASGQAWGFRALESQYRADPAEYIFRRRLETLEKGLASRTYTVVDSRFLRDGGEIWMTH